MAGDSDNRIRLKVRGERVAHVGQRDWLGGNPELGIKIALRERVELAATRDGGSALTLPPLEPDTVACVEYVDGFRLWTRSDDLRNEFAAPLPGSRGTDQDGVWEIDAYAGGPVSSRGLGKRVIQALEFFDIDLASTTAEGLAGWFEKRQLQDGRAGLCRIDLTNDGSLAHHAGTIGGAGKAVLVFLHGTASSTRGSFGKLWQERSQAQRAAVAALQGRFGSEIYGFEHHTLTESPIDNALQLADRLRDGSELHLVSHSRGGLVGELLCLGERKGGAEVLNEATLDRLFTRADLSDLLGHGGEVDKAWYQEQRAKLVQLLALLDRKGLRVRRFVRAACPARGTTLASARLDRWLSVLDYIGGETFVGDAIWFLLEVVKRRTDPRSLPGLEAMMPQSALVRLLNHPRLGTNADLSIIAGDLKPGSLWERVKYAVTDWFYASEHDLVVNTGSMYGGLRRDDNKVRQLFDEGADVNHFRYFTNAGTVRALVSGLLRQDADIGLFKSLAEARHKDDVPASRAAIARSARQGPRPIAIVLPGTMGSALSVSGDRVWLQYLDLAFGGLDKLSIDASGVSADGLLEDFYGEFLVYLSRSHEVRPYAYDWRLSLADSVQGLADMLDAALTDCEVAGQPLHLVAHSMGGLVARLTLARHPRLWQRMQRLANSRLLMLGTPNRGSHEAVRWLTGFNPTLTKLRLLDITSSRNGLLKIVSRYPGLLELLPSDDAAHDFAEPGFWSGLRGDLNERWPLPPGRGLSGARRLWRELADAPTDPDRLLYVAGCAELTVNGFEVDPTGDNSVPGFPRPLLRFFGTRRGDGTVTWDNGRLPGVPTWYVEGAQHDALLTHAAAFPAYVELLQTGQTVRLPKNEPVAASRDSRSLDERIPVPPAVPDSIPSESDLRGFVFGGGRISAQARSEARATRVRLAVHHGNLVYANSPVCVGHYAGDTIVSAERALDAGLDGALSERALLDLYPGALGTHHVFIHPDRFTEPGGAVVVGLGEVGGLTPGRLEAALVAAFLDYAYEVARWPDDRFGAADGTGPRSAKLNCLLIGTGFDNMSVGDSVTAILRAVTRANARLRISGLDGNVLIDELTLLELYEDVAIQMAHDLERLLDTDEFREHLEWPARELEQGVGGHRRVRFEEAPNWWHRLEIVYLQETSRLRFHAFTDRARIEESLSAGDMRLADDFIRDALADTRDDPRVSKTLFEMLIPNRLKQQAPDKRDMVLVVDGQSARFPWELLRDGWSQDGKPMAVAAGMLRQLKLQAGRQRNDPIHSMALNALVVGDPDLTPRSHEPSPAVAFDQLDGARREAEAVGDTFRRHGYQAREVINGRAGDIVTALHDGGYRVLHLAGHGVHRMARPPSGETISGMVIGADRFLTPGDVRQMRVVPELVFINCCHLGRSEAPERLNELAANLGVEFIEMGVRAVIAAGWAVEDAAATRFARVFYEAMFGGEAFGDACRAAREAVWRRHPGSNTWGAYQCYGDPGFRLRVTDTVSQAAPRRPFVSPAELVVELNNLCGRIKTSAIDGDTVSWMRGRIDQLLGRVPGEVQSDWLSRADVCEALGILYGELGETDDAVRYLDQALRGERGGMSLRALEQRANFLVRAAVASTIEDDRDETRQLADARAGQAITDLARLCEFASTSERQALLGAAYKRRAILNTDHSLRSQWLEASVRHYGEAFALCEKTGQADCAYSRTQWLTARVLDALGGTQRTLGTTKKLRSEVDLACDEIRAQAAARDRVVSNFWNTAVMTDCLVLSATVHLNFAEQSDDITVLALCRRKVD